MLLVMNRLNNPSDLITLDNKQEITRGNIFFLHFLKQQLLWKFTQWNDFHCHSSNLTRATRKTSGTTWFLVELLTINRTIVPADDLTPNSDRSIAAAILTMKDKQILIIHEERFQLPVPSQCREIIKQMICYFNFCLGLMAISTQWLLTGALDMTPYLMQKLLSDSNTMYM